MHAEFGLQPAMCVWWNSFLFFFFQLRLEARRRKMRPPQARRLLALATRSGMAKSAALHSRS